VKRHRAPVEGGYRRKTVCIPEELARRIDEHLKNKRGLTWSAYVSDELERALPPEPRRN